MAKSIYHKYSNGEVAARVIIRERISDDDLIEAIAEAHRRAEASRRYKEQRLALARATKAFYRAGGYRWPNRHTDYWKDIYAVRPYVAQPPTPTPHPLGTYTTV